MFTKKTRVLFICMGNICRSPTAEGVFRKMVDDSSLAKKIEIDSAGTIGSHAGSKPDPRAIELASSRGYTLEKLRARQVTPADFERYDHIIAMDAQNLKHLREICPPELADKVELLMDFAPQSDSREVPDPYYGSAADFEHALVLIEQGCEGLLTHILHPHVARPKLRRRAG
ncbi:MAG: low molecular weight protein-tyrosine-phosphatase [Betaproteobacteria bacterium]